MKIDLLVSSLCCEIDDLYEELLYQKEQTKYWKEKYNEILDSNISHGNAMMGNIMEILLTPGVANSFVKNSKLEN